jgi:uncharacterized protein
MSKSVEFPEVKIIETEKAKLKQPLVILGFAGAGLVGGIAVTHIIEQLKMTEIAHVRSKYTSPVVVFLDGRLRQPFRVYSNERGTLCAIVCEIPLRSEGLHFTASALMDWIEEQGTKELAVLDGFAVKRIPKERKSFCVAEPEKRKECEKKGVNMLTAGIIGGLAGSMLNECLTRKITGAAFLVPTFAFIPDPEGAAVLITTLSQVYNLKLDPTELLTKAAETKRKLKRIAERHRNLIKAEETKGLSDRPYIA